MEKPRLVWIGLDASEMFDKRKWAAMLQAFDAAAAEADAQRCAWPTANLRTKILDFRGFDSSRILILRGGIPRPTGNFPETWSQQILVGRFLVERLGASLGFVLPEVLRVGPPPGAAFVYMFGLVCLVADVVKYKLLVFVCLLLWVPRPDCKFGCLRPPSVRSAPAPSSPPAYITNYVCMCIYIYI